MKKVRTLEEKIKMKDRLQVFLMANTESLNNVQKARIKDRLKRMNEIINAEMNDQTVFLKVG